MQSHYVMTIQVAGLPYQKNLTTLVQCIEKSYSAFDVLEINILLNLAMLTFRLLNSQHMPA